MKAEKREYEGEDQVEEEEEEEEEDEGLMELLLSSPSPCSSYSSSMFCYSGRAQEAAQRPSDSSLSALSSSPSSNSATACSQASLKEEEINGGMRSSSGSKREKRGGTGSNKGTIKARKERLGERIAVLQQLVSPFGKSDTASVLNEVLAYIRFLHEQVEVLSSPYLLQRLPSSSYLQQMQPWQEIDYDITEMENHGSAMSLKF